MQTAWRLSVNLYEEDNGLSEVEEALEEQRRLLAAGAWAAEVLEP